MNALRTSWLPQTGQVAGPASLTPWSNKTNGTKNRHVLLASRRQRHRSRGLSGLRQPRGPQGVHRADDPLQGFGLGKEGPRLERPEGVVVERVGERVLERLRRRVLERGRPGAGEEESRLSVPARSSSSSSSGSGAKESSGPGHEGVVRVVVVLEHERARLMADPAQTGSASPRRPRSSRPRTSTSGPRRSVAGPAMESCSRSSSAAAGSSGGARSGRSSPGRAGSGPATSSPACSRRSGTDRSRRRAGAPGRTGIRERVVATATAILGLPRVATGIRVFDRFGRSTGSCSRPASPTTRSSR